MADFRLDVIGVGNAIVDVLADADDAFLETHAIPKGGMQLIDERRAKEIYGGMGPGREVSGGSAANTIACVASLGGRGGFVGKVADDALGDIFRHDLRALGVVFDTAPLRGREGTARSLVNVTPDSQRSMSTYLGAASRLSPDDVEASMIATGAILFFEGYLFEMPAAKEAFVKACGAAKAAGARVALTLSDSHLVERQKNALASFIHAYVDILLANEREAAALFGVSDHTAIEAAARALSPMTAVTLSERGSILIAREERAVHVDAVKPAKLVDTTGAGDAYAAGLLYGLSQNFELGRAGALGSLAAAEVISHFGARPERSLKSLAREHRLL